MHRLCEESRYSALLRPLMHRDTGRKPKSAADFPWGLASRQRDAMDEAGWPRNEYPFPQYTVWSERFCVQVSEEARQQLGQLLMPWLAQLLEEAAEVERRRIAKEKGYKDRPGPGRAGPFIARLLDVLIQEAVHYAAASHKWSKLMDRVVATAQQWPGWAGMVTAHARCFANKGAFCYPAPPCPQAEMGLGGAFPAVFAYPASAGPGAGYYSPPPVAVSAAAGQPGPSNMFSRTPFFPAGISQASEAAGAMAAQAAAVGATAAQAAARAPKPAAPATAQKRGRGQLEGQVGAGPTPKAPRLGLLETLNAIMTGPVPAGPVSAGGGVAGTVPVASPVAPAATALVPPPDAPSQAATLPSPLAAALAALPLTQITGALAAAARAAAAAARPHPMPLPGSHGLRAPAPAQQPPAADAALAVQLASLGSQLSTVEGLLRQVLAGNVQGAVGSGSGGAPAFAATAGAAAASPEPVAAAPPASAPAAPAALAQVAAAAGAEPLRPVQPALPPALAAAVANLRAGLAAEEAAAAARRQKEKEEKQQQKKKGLTNVYNQFISHLAKIGQLPTDEKGFAGTTSRVQALWSEAKENNPELIQQLREEVERINREEGRLSSSQLKSMR